MCILWACSWHCHDIECIKNNFNVGNRKYKRLQEHNVDMYKLVLVPVARQHKSELFVQAHGSIGLSNDPLQGSKRIQPSPQGSQLGCFVRSRCTSELSSNFLMG